jgi:hypothetical protein
MVKTKAMRILWLWAVLLSGCAVSFHNAARIAYMDEHPAFDACILEQGVDPGELEEHLRNRDPLAARHFLGEKYRGVEMCYLASRAQDQLIAQIQAPQYEANDLAMIGLGAYLSRQP